MKEIDLRALLIDNLKSDYFTESCSTFVNDIFGNNVIIRDFNNLITWSKTKQTNFIESIFMGCEIPVMVLFRMPVPSNNLLLVDGVNRFITICKFLNDELRLNPEGIQRAKFLEGKKFSELNSNEEREYFMNRLMQVLIYSSQKPLEIEEINAIAKQLYLRYNSGIQLKTEEIQKADYQEDAVTLEIEKMIGNPTFLDRLANIHLTPSKKTKTFYESTLMYCRLVITSCYAPFDSFSMMKSISKQIDKFYIDYTLDIPKKTILKDFNETVNYLYELTQQSYWKNYPRLSNKYFLWVTYWLMFHIKKM